MAFLERTLPKIINGSPSEPVVSFDTPESKLKRFKYRLMLSRPDGIEATGSSCQRVTERKRNRNKFIPHTLSSAREARESANGGGSMLEQPTLLEGVLGRKRADGRKRFA